MFKAGVVVSPTTIGGKNETENRIVKVMNLPLIVHYGMIRN